MYFKDGDLKALQKNLRGGFKGVLGGRQNV